MAKAKLDLPEEYLILAPQAESFCAELQRQLALLLGQQGLRLGLPIERHMKDWPAIAAALEGMPEKPASCKEISGLIGLRLVLLFRRDALRAAELIERQFKVVSRISQPEAGASQPFTDQVFHFHIEIPEAWKVIPSMALGRDLRVEVRICTLAHHLCLASQEIVDGKGTPASARRAFTRAANLLETVDLELERALEQLEPADPPVESQPPTNGRLLPERLAPADGDPQQQDIDILIEPPGLQRARSEQAAQQEQHAMRLFDTINGTRDKSRRQQLLGELKSAQQASVENVVVRRLLAKACHGLLSEASGDSDKPRRDQWLAELRGLYKLNPDDATIRGLLARGLSQMLSETNDAALRNPLLAELRAIQQAFPDDATVRKLLVKI